MSVFIELRDGHIDLDESSNAPGALGPVLGPFIAARLLRDELRVTTAAGEKNRLSRVADWTYYNGQYFSDVEIVGDDQIGAARARRRCAFQPELAEINECLMA